MRPRVLSAAELPPEAPLGHATDERGHRYGWLEVIYRADVGVFGLYAGCAWWVCKCDCGNFTLTRGYSLRQGDTQSCGCLSKVVDITGQRFGHLVALRFVGIENNNALWECRCDCGGTTTTRGGNLRSGQTKSCRIGCDGRPEWVRERERAFNRYVASARKREIPFNLALEKFGLLAQQPCHYCGADPCGEAWPHNGLDRLNPNGSYAIDNIVPCCSACNYAKNSMNYDDFLALVARIHQHRKLGDVVNL